jgi:hypothetical protein
MTGVIGRVAGHSTDRGKKVGPLENQRRTVCVKTIMCLRSVLECDYRKERECAVFVASREGMGLAADSTDTL